MRPGATQLPGDCRLLPTGQGGLLVSREHAVFCGVPAGELEEVRRLLSGRVPPGELSRSLLDALDRHGFFAPPRTPKPARPTVQIQLTNDCNLACSYCCTNSGAPRRQEVSRSRVCEVLETVREQRGPGARVGFLGGEPLLVPWALDVVAHALDLELRPTLFTNGVPLADEAVAVRVADLAQRGVEVRVSLAGSAPEAVVEGIGRVRQHGGAVQVDVMLLPGQVDDVARTMPELRRRLPPGTKVAFGIAYRSGRVHGAHLFESGAAVEAALDRVAFEAGEVIPAEERSPVAPRREGCTCALGHHLHVRSDGALFTCYRMEEQVGDLRREAFRESLSRLDEQARPAAALELCSDCALATLCGGGCRSENILFSGDADVPVCGPWRVRVLSELLAEDRPSAVTWSAAHLLAEARARGIDGPDELVPVRPSQHLVDL